MARASIVVLNFNGKPCIRRTLKAALGQSYRDTEVIVVDNQSTDGSPEIVEREFPKAKLARNTSNAGICLGYNFGISRAKGKYIATIANDMILDRHWMKEAVKALESDSKLAAVGSYIKNDKKGYYRGEEVYGFYLDLLGNAVPIHKKPQGYIFGPNGVLLRKDALGKEPYDNKGLFFFADDTYIGWKILLSGMNAKPAEKAVIYHIGHVGAGTVSEFVEFHAEKDRLMSPLIFYEAKTLLKITPLLLVNIATGLLLSAMRGRARIRLKSYFWILRNIGRIMAERRSIQKQRKVPDREALKYMTYRTPYPLGPFQPIAQKMLRLYCILLGIQVMELQREIS